MCGRTRLCGAKVTRVIVDVSAAIVGAGAVVAVTVRRTFFSGKLSWLRTVPFAGVWIKFAETINCLTTLRRPHIATHARRVHSNAHMPCGPGRPMTIDRFARRLNFAGTLS